MPNYNYYVSSDNDLSSAQQVAVLRSLLEDGDGPSADGILWTQIPGNVGWNDLYAGEISEAAEVVDSADVCAFLGVTCNARSQITHLDLSSDPWSRPRLSVSLSNSTLGELPYLASLNLNGVSVKGGVPANLSIFSNLKNLQLRSCGLTGPPPRLKMLPTGLEKLDLRENRLEGIVENVEEQYAWDPNYRYLRQLYLGENSLRGTIPDLSGFKELQAFDLGKNKFNDTIPSDMTWKMKNLKTLALNDNRLTGTLPYYIKYMKNLEYLDLSRNDLTGTIPYSVTKLHSLKHLFLHDNNFYGTLPPEFGKDWSPLIGLWLMRNQLSGTVPGSLARGYKLQHFFIDGNSFSGVIPEPLCNKDLNQDYFYEETNQTRIGEKILDDYSDFLLEKCQHIACPIGYASDHRDGVYPCAQCDQLEQAPFLGTAQCLAMDEKDTLMRLRNATNAALWEDDLRHDRNLCRWKGVSCENNRVVSLNLASSRLAGRIPREIGRLRRLRTLNLSDNGLYGNVPAELTLLPDLTELDLTGNRLAFVPPSLCSRPALNDRDRFRYRYGECDHILCPAGKYNEHGRQVRKFAPSPGSDGGDWRELACRSCYDAPHLGTSRCPGMDSPEEFLGAEAGATVSDIGVGASVASLFGYLVLFSLIVCAGVYAVFVVRRRRREDRESSIEYVKSYPSADDGEEDEAACSLPHYRKDSLSLSAEDSPRYRKDSYCSVEESVEVQHDESKNCTYA